MLKSAKQLKFPDLCCAAKGGWSICSLPALKQMNQWIYALNVKHIVQWPSAQHA